MNNINVRIQELIHALNIKKTTFAGHLNVSQAFVSQICSGVSQPSDRTIADICREFNVNEEWLRTGHGEMFQPKSRNEMLLEYALDVAESPSSDIKVQILSVMAKLNSDQWEVLAQVAKMFLDEANKAHKKESQK